MGETGVCVVYLWSFYLIGSEDGESRDDSPHFLYLLYEVYRHSTEHEIVVESIVLTD